MGFIELEAQDEGVLAENWEGGGGGLGLFVYCTNMQYI
jgi:hypothetical protein